MKFTTSVVVLSSLLYGAAEACTPVTYADGQGRELSREEVVQLFFNAHTFVLVGDVVEVEEVKVYETVNGRQRPHAYQKATVVVRKSWKPSKSEGDKLYVYTDLGDSCSRVLELASQPLIYANGAEPVHIEGWGSISEQGFSSEDVVYLNRIPSAREQTTKPNKALQRTRSSNAPLSASVMHRRN